MKYFADIHIHSYYSRATSKNLNLEHLSLWGQIKGLSVVATGDISHPKWLEEMREKLVPADNGLYRLKPEYIQTTQDQVPGACEGKIQFILSGEISNIYKRGGQVRKVHNVVLFPSLESVARFQKTLDKIGNITSDGRPILGLDSRDLLEIVLDTDERGVLIPAHIWTPWFSMLGSKSGFDTVEACFGDLTSHIFAMETGLSSDPPMNWRLSMLDPYTLVSNSDAHSPAKLAREANVFNTDLSYDAMMNALRNKSSDAFWGTLEFFPEEGKYHMDGHRKCNTMLEPRETITHNGLCPVCGKPVTLGVSYRVEELADRPENTRPDNAKPFTSLVPLPEVLSEIKGVGPNSKTVQTWYQSLLRELGPELKILMDLPLSDLETAGGALMAEAIRRIRAAQVLPQPGYDGEFGIIRVFQPDEKQEILNQGALFNVERKPAVAKTNRPEAPAEISTPAATTVIQEATDTEYGLNPEQQAAVDHRGSPLAIIAGPGTGKTRTLTHRIASLVNDSSFPAESILAVTFTRKAAEEMRQRLSDLLTPAIAAKMPIHTFHALGAELLRHAGEFYGRTPGFHIIDPEKHTVLHQRFQAKQGKLTKTLLRHISLLKGEGFSPDAVPEATAKDLPESVIPAWRTYEALLVELNAVDYDDLVCLPLQLLRKQPDLRRQLTSHLRGIAVDEFQDINRSQYELFSLLAVTADNVCIIGDPDQAIYGFRGASNAFFAQFTTDFSNAATIRLQRNYRSAQNILNASVQILNKPEAPPQEQIWSNLAPEVKVVLHHSATDKAEAEFMVHRIEQLIGGTSFFSLDSSRVDDRGLPQDYTFADMAILLRSRQLLPEIKTALDRSGIPYLSFDESRLADDAVHACLISALCLAAGQNMSESDKKALTAPFFSNRDQEPDLGPDLMPRQMIAPAPYIKLLNSLTHLEDNATLHDILQIIWVNLKQILPDAEAYQSWINKLMQLAQNNNSITNFMDTLLLQTHTDIWDDRAEAVRILTMHASKGLEFPVVFIPGCEENIIPHRIRGQETDLDEERRLLYVGMTRAKQQLYLVHANKRLLYGETKQRQPSRFLAAISSSLLQREQGQYKSKPQTKQMDLF